MVVLLVASKEIQQAPLPALPSMAQHDIDMSFGFLGVRGFSGVRAAIPNKVGLTSREKTLNPKS